MSDADSGTSFDSGKEAVGAVYAKALLEAATKAGQVDRVAEELESAKVDVFDRLPRLMGTLVSPRVSFTDKERILENAFKGKMSDILLNFLKVFARRGRFDAIAETAAAFKKLYNESRGRVEVQVRTAAPINNQLLQRIADRLKEMLGRDVVLKSKVDSELLGGVVVRVGDTLYDGSVSRKLELLREKTLKDTQAAIRNSLEQFAT